MHKKEKKSLCPNCGKMRNVIDVCDHVEAKADESIPRIWCQVNCFKVIQQYLKRINFSNDNGRGVRIHFMETTTIRSICKNNISIVQYVVKIF